MLAHRTCTKQSYERRKVDHWILAFCWLLGLLYGIFTFQKSGTFLLSIIRSIPDGAVSIISLLCVSLFPLLLSGIVVSYSKTELIFPICFFKAFLFSYVSIGILLSFGTAGWLFRYILLFADLVTVPILYLFWHRNLGRNSRLYAWEFILTLTLMCLAVSIEFSIMLPFLTSLIDF